MDLIDRQAAIDIAPKLIVTLDGYEMHNQAVANYCAEITQLPPAQPERIKGRWKNKGEIRAWDVCGIETFGVKRECTNCGFVHIFIEDHGHYPYCPICRADME